MDTIEYTYGSARWKDLLTKYNGKTVAYTNSGNMRLYGDNTYSWTGRRMTSAVIDGVACSYTYNADGIRTTKTVNGVKTEYFLNGSNIIAQKTGDDVMWFFYDANGTRIGMYYNGVTYYYLYNLQGDVVALARAYNGKIVAKYSYDAWGNCTVTNASGTTIGDINPFRYRGYYYDTESGFYYLNSRYYAPEFGRFISADTAAVVAVSPDSASYDKNLYAYCDNNPVCRKDDGGQFWNIAAGAVIGAAISSVSQIMANVASPESGLFDGVCVAAITGAASGALSATGLGRLGQSLSNAVIGFAGELANQHIAGTRGAEGSNIKLLKALGAGAISGFIGGNGMRHKTGNYYKAAQNAKATVLSVWSKPYGNPNTPIKLISRAANMVSAVGQRESLITGIKFATGSAVSQIITRTSL